MVNPGIIKQQILGFLPKYMTRFYCWEHDIVWQKDIGNSFSFQSGNSPRWLAFSLLEGAKHAVVDKNIDGLTQLWVVVVHRAILTF